MKIYLLSFLIFSCTRIFAQSALQKELLKIEAENKNQMMGSPDLHKLVIDLDNDGDSDYIFAFVCSELYCINVYMNENGHLKKVINEMGGLPHLYSKSDGKQLTISHNGCCGDHYTSSNITFDFKNDAAITTENYSQSENMLVPKFYVENSYRVTILNEDYNLRFSPNTAENRYARQDGVLEAKTNILAKLPTNISVKVLSEIIEKDDRTWLYVEVLNKDVNEKKSIVELFNVQQNLRGWISAKYVRKD